MYILLNVRTFYGRKGHMPRKKGDMPTVRRMTVLLPEELYKRLRHEAADTDFTMSEIIAEALTKHFEKGGKKEKK